MKKIGQALVAAAFAGLVACGGGSGDSEDPLRRYTARVQVSGLATGEQVVFTIAGEQVTASTNTTFASSSTVVGEWQATVVTPPAGKTCRFNGDSLSYQGSDSTISLACGTGTSVGGAGPVSQVEGSFQHWPWKNLVKVSGAPMWILPVSLLDFDNSGLTGATTSNFEFELADRAPIIPGSEFRAFVQPITVGNIYLRGSIAVDVSTSFPDSDLTVIKNELAGFLGNAQTNHIYRLTTFDGTVVEQQTWTDGSSSALLQSAAQNIPLTGRVPATNIYAAAAEAAQSRTPDLAVLDHMVIITDGEDYSTDTYGDYSDHLDHELIFVIQIGDLHETDRARLETLVQAGTDETMPARIIQVADPSGVSEALALTRSWMQSMAGGLHHMWVGLPYEDGEVRLTFRTNPSTECDVEASLAGCGWYIDLDTTGSVVPSNVIFPIPNSIEPNAGDTVRFDIPQDWRLCSDNPMFNWGPLTLNQGSATGTSSADGYSYDLTLGATGPIDVAFSVTDTASATGCASGTVSVMVP